MDPREIELVVDNYSAWDVARVVEKCREMENKLELQLRQCPLIFPSTAKWKNLRITQIEDYISKLAEQEGYILKELGQQAPAYELPEEVFHLEELGHVQEEQRKSKFTTGKNEDNRNRRFQQSPTPQHRGTGDTSATTAYASVVGV